CARGGGYFDVW
nr:immunoglobulin heavy chain junction region [Macaca mulatta]MOW21777.1 immunoglobulin heavy chain junction region [Macaca mulatta]